LTKSTHKNLRITEEYFSGSNWRKIKNHKAQLVYVILIKRKECTDVTWIINILVV